MSALSGCPKAETTFIPPNPTAETVVVDSIKAATTPSSFSITSDLAVVNQRLASVFAGLVDWLCKANQRLASVFADLVDWLCKANQRLMSPPLGDLAEWLCKANQRLMSPSFGCPAKSFSDGDLAEWLCKAF